MDPSRAEALKSMSLAATADELCDFIHCCRWMSIVIPGISTRVAPLVEALESAYKGKGSRKKGNQRTTTSPTFQGHGTRQHFL